MYLMGATVKDLSLRFGIYPARVKAIVYQKHLYWEEIYPRVGETAMRLALECEMMYAAEYPFLEYGQDIKGMAMLEQGVLVERWTACKHEDAQVKERRRTEAEMYLSKLRVRR